MCSGPGCDVQFSALGLNWRHHCRLCGEIYCHGCSPHKTDLPLHALTGTDGSKEKKEGGVRICDGCKEDIDRRRGDTYTMRRYLVPLHHFTHDAAATNDEVQEIATALRCLHSDIDRLVQTGGEAHLVPLPAQVMGPMPGHLDHSSTELPALLALGAVLAWANMRDDGSYAAAAYEAEEFDRDDAPPPGGADVLLPSLFRLLERNASTGNADVLAAQEQAARALAYLTDPNVLSYLPGSALDVHRAMRSCLDHLTSTHVSLQRWAAACAVYLLLEDGRRWTGSDGGYAAFTPLLTETGGHW